MPNNDYILRSDALKAILGVSIYDTIEELEGARTIGESTWADGLYDAYKIIEEEVDAANVEPVRKWIPVTDDSLKEVEDTCRAMIASYEADKLTFEQYDGSDSAEKQSWADQARMRANRTAANYNEYIRKNSFIWADAVPADIDEKLDYIEEAHR